MTKKFLAGFMMALGLCIFSIGQVSGEKYVFNMTEELEEEGRLLPYCIADHKMKIPDIEEFCSTRIGSLHNNYGDKIE